MIPITAKYIQDYFWLNRTTKKKHSISTVEATICSHYNIPIDAIYERTRVRRIVECRHVIWWYLRKHGMTFQAISEQYLMKDHTTIISAINKIKNIIEVDIDMKRNIAAINTQLNILK